MHIGSFVRGKGKFVVTEYIATDEKSGPRYTSPRRSAKPPAARTGIGATASTTIGMSGILPIQPT
jgi:hypothetical protein